jgi:hypothetical protein
MSGGNRNNVQLFLGKLKAENLKGLYLDGKILLKQVTRNYPAIN